MGRSAGAELSFVDRGVVLPRCLSTDMSTSPPPPPSPPPSIAFNQFVILMLFRIAYFILDTDLTLSPKELQFVYVQEYYYIIKKIVIAPRYVSSTWAEVSTEVSMSPPPPPHRIALNEIFYLPLTPKELQHVSIQEYNNSGTREVTLIVNISIVR